MRDIKGNFLFKIKGWGEAVLAERISVLVG
jgi:hypothetical protein